MIWPHACITCCTEIDRSCYRRASFAEHVRFCFYNQLRSCDVLYEILVFQAGTLEEDPGFDYKWSMRCISAELINMFFSWFHHLSRSQNKMDFIWNISPGSMHINWISSRYLPLTHCYMHTSVRLYYCGSAGEIMSILWSYSYSTWYCIFWVNHTHAHVSDDANSSGAQLTQ